MMSTKPLLGVGKWLPKPCNNTYGFICNRDLGEFMPLLWPEVKNENIQNKQIAWHHPDFPLGNTGWHCNALYMYLTFVLYRPKHPKPTWYNYPRYLRHCGQWQFQGCDQKSHLGGCQEELWGWQSQLGFNTKRMVNGLRWVDGQESQSTYLDRTQQTTGTRLRPIQAITQCMIIKQYPTHFKTVNWHRTPLAYNVSGSMGHFLWDSRWSQL